jgi:hypothetical protein
MIPESTIQIAGYCPDLNYDNLAIGGSLLIILYTSLDILQSSGLLHLLAVRLLKAQSPLN